MAILAELDPARWATVDQAAVQLLSDVERREIRNASDAATLIPAQMPVGLTQSEQRLVTTLVTPLVAVNSSFSQTLTDQAKAAAAAGVAIVKDTLKAGQVIVDQGHQITESDMIKIRFFGLDSSRTDWGKPAAWLVLVGLIFAMVALAEKLPAGRAWLPYAIPTAAVGMLLTVLLDAGTGTVVLALLAVLAGMVNGSSLELTGYVFLGGLSGILAIRKGERQQFFVQAAVCVALADLVVVGAFTMLGQALIASVVTLGSFALLGNLFGILTGSQLLELANPSQPLLRRLLVETPGTYHHSLMVGNLAERAAESIGADPLLARVATTTSASSPTRWYSSRTSRTPRTSTTSSTRKTRPRSSNSTSRTGSTSPTRRGCRSR